MNYKYPELSWTGNQGKTRTVDNGSRVQHLNQMTTHDDNVGKFWKFVVALISICKKRKQILNLLRDGNEYEAQRTSSCYNFSTKEYKCR